jgi:hypothetical protein
MLMMLIFVSHLMACFWGLTGHFFLVMDCELGYPVITASSEGTAYPDGSMDMNYNWIVSAQKDGSPDNMCDPFAVYLWSLHYSVMTITSIGYGDFTPQRMEEYMVGIICMLLGGIMWAYIIGNLCATMGALDPIEMNYRTRYDQLNNMLDEHDLPTGMRIKTRDYFRESKQLMKAGAQSELMEMVSTALRGEVSQKMTHYKYLRNVPYFAGCGIDFLVEICQKLTHELFAPREEFPRYSRLWIIVRGSASQAGRIFLPGMYIGKEFVLDSLALQHGSDTMAMTFCECKVLTKNSLVEILKDYPLECKVIRKHALMIAWRQAVRLIQRHYRLSRPDLAGLASRMTKNQLMMGDSSKAAENSSGKRISVSDMDTEELLGAKGDYFSDRNMQRALRQ